MLKGFKDFLLKDDILDLAVAVVIGNALNAVITSLVKDLINPLIASFSNITEFSKLSFTLNNTTFMVGDLLNSITSFIVIGAVIYFLVVLPKEHLTRDDK